MKKLRHTPYKDERDIWEQKARVKENQTARDHTRDQNNVLCRGRKMLCHHKQWIILWKIMPKR